MRAQCLCEPVARVWFIDGKEKAAVFRRMQTLLTTTPKARLVAGFGERFNSLEISPG
jgi:hypothetical protein